MSGDVQSQPAEERDHRRELLRCRHSMNEKELIRKAMSVLGKRTSKAKTEAARKNGKKGGRRELNRAAIAKAEGRAS